MGFVQLAFGFIDDPTAAPAGPALPAQGRHVATSPSLVLDHPQGNRDIVLKGQRVRYALRRGRRRTIGFVVGAEGLSVSAPRWVGLQEVETALLQKAPWILRKLQEQGERNQRLDAARIDWADGTRVPYLGRLLRVAVGAGPVVAPGGAMLVLSQGLASCAEARPLAAGCAVHANPGGGEGAYLWLGLPPDAQAERIRDVVHSWWQRQARSVFEERCALYAPRLGVKVRRLSLSSAQTRWGSATADGAVRLNWRLIQFPLSTIDYVVVHELAHLREMNHSAAFWEVVRSVLPEYELAQGSLKSAVPLSG